MDPLFSAIIEDLSLRPVHIPRAYTHFLSLSTLGNVHISVICNGTVNKSVQIFGLLKRTRREKKTIQRLRRLYLSLVRSNSMYPSCV